MTLAWARLLRWPRDLFPLGKRTSCMSIPGSLTKYIRVHERQNRERPGEGRWTARECRQVSWPRSHSQPTTAVVATPSPVRSETPDAGLDDTTLVAAARANPEYFTLLYERYARQIYRYCYLKLGSREAAEDVTSQVFLDAFTDLPTFRGGTFAGWLFRIAQHTVSDSRRRDRRQAGTVEIDTVSGLTDRAPLPEEAAVTRSDLDEIRIALRRLPRDQRLVVEFELADLTTREIASALGRSANAVRILRFRAYAQLRPMLADLRIERRETARGGAR